MAESENQDDKANSENKIPENETGEQKLKREHPMYYAFVKNSLPKVKKLIAAEKARIAEMQKKIQQTKAEFKKAMEAMVAKRSFSAKVYCLGALEGVKKIAGKIAVVASNNYQDLKAALTSGSKTVSKAAVNFIKIDIPSKMLVIKPRKKEKGKEEEQEKKKKPEEVEKDAKAKKKNVAKAVNGADVSQQKDRVMVRTVDAKQKEQAMRLGDALQQQKKSSLEHEAALAIEQMVKIKTERAEKDQQLVKEQAAKKITMEKNNEIQLNQKKQMDALVKENKAQNIELNLPKQKAKNENQQFDWSKNNKVIETKAQEVKLKKESEKVVEETKKAVNNSKKEALNRLRALSGRNGHVGALKNDFAKAGMAIDFTNLKPKYKVKIEQAQEQAREQIAAKEINPKVEKSFELRPDYATDEFKKAWEERDSQAHNKEGNEEQKVKKEKPLSKKQTMTLMRNGINPKLEATKVKKAPKKTHNLNQPSKTIDMNAYNYMRGGKQTG